MPQRKQSRRPILAPTQRMGLRFKLLGILMLVLGVTQTSVGIHQYRATSQANHQFITEQLQRAAHGLQPQLDAAADALSQLAAQIAVSIDEQADGSGTVQQTVAAELLASVSSFHLYDDRGQELASWGHDPVVRFSDAARRERVQRATETGAPRRSLECAEECRIEVWLPLIHHTGALRVARISEPLVVVLQRMYQVLGIDLILTTTDGRNGPRIFGRGVLAMSRADSLRPSLAAFARASQLAPDQSAISVRADDTHWVLSSQAIGWQPAAEASIVLAMDVGDYQAAVEQASRRTALVSGAGLLVSLLAVMWLISPTLHRLRNVTTALPLLADNDFDGARARIGRAAPQGLAPTDEVDALKQSARWLADRLETLAEVESESQAKSEYLAMASHEIRTPLNGILGMLELLWNAPMTPGQREQIRVALDSAEALRAVIDDILDMSRIEARRLDLESAEFVLADVVHQAAATWWVRAVQKGLDLLVFVDPRLAPQFVGDANRLRQVLLNLISNAVKFTAVGQVSIHVTPAPHQAVRIAIADSGIGISPDAQARLFEPFAQASRSTSRQYGGSGLGLSICRGLVELMGGTIRLDSQPGRGSCFTLELPLKPADARTAPLELGPLDVDLSRLTSGDEQAVLQSYLEAENLRISPQTADLYIEEAPGALRQLRIRSAQGSVAMLQRPVSRRQLRQALLTVTHADTADAPASNPLLVTGHQHRRVLIVEDHPVNRTVLTRQLERLGYQVTGCECAEQALQRLGLAPYALVITDLEMPGMDGLSFCRTVRAQASPNQHTPIVVATAHTLRFNREHAMAAGATDYLVKPISLDGLNSMLGRILDEPSTAAAPSSAGIRRHDEPIDTRYLVDELGVDPAELQDMLRMFIDTNRGPLAEMSTAVARCDWHRVEGLTHRVLGSARTAGAAQLSEALEALSESARRQDANVLARFTRVEQAFVAIEQYVGAR